MINDEMMDKAKLCYIEGSWAYFTTQDVAKQWGDDWNDAPYEHNAGPPYEYHEFYKKRGDKPWEIIKVAWDGDFKEPCDDCFNSGYSVQMINRGDIAWLRPYSKNGKPIMAGTALKDFIEKISSQDGTVYFPYDYHKTREELGK